MVKKALVLSLVLCAAQSLISCAPVSGTADGRVSGTAIEELAPEEDDRLVIYTSHKEEVWWPIVREFEDRTGIWVQVESGGTNELLARLEEEKENPYADLMFGGGGESLEACRDLFEPYITSEEAYLDPRFTDEEHCWTPFTALPEVLIYNTKLVEEGSLKGWADLLKEEYRGQIAFADPDRSGSAYTGLVTMLAALEKTREGTRNENLRLIAESLGGRELPGSGDVLTGVAGGMFRVGVTLEETAMQHIEEGDNLSLVYPEEGTSAVPDGCALVRGAAHRDNGARFIDFVVGKDVQEQVAGRFYRRPVRTDVASPEKLPPLEKMNLLDYPLEEASEDRDSILISWKLFCAPDEGGKETP